ncbi:MAG: hypothetical protein BroJett040_21260 [Oligoflexia bacterium]|nr:MAG: hypothetical protein BroJett040_21260 [Oligoflexia bacterium]
MKSKVGTFFTENLSYKIVSLFIALILWVTILGRRDFTLAKNLEVEFFVAQNQTLISQSTDHIKVKVSGPRTALRKFIDSGVSQLVSVDLSGKPEGTYSVEIPLNRIDVPFGVKVLSIKPNQIQVQVGKKE